MSSSFKNNSVSTDVKPPPTGCDNSLLHEYYNDPSEFIKKLTKYIIEGTVVALVAKWVSSKKLTLQEIGIISLMASSTFILLDLYSPSISAGYRQGVGLVLGAKSVL